MMKDFIFFMHNDAIEATVANDQSRWERYFQRLRESGQFEGGSAIGTGRCYSRSDSTSEISAHLTGYIRLRAGSVEEAEAFLKGNPIYEAGGTVEIRELPRT